ncbi:hypothetical protein ACN42_g6326 [Penicillium freii]|uniref:Uncharacterized protein n=1 Tax=Penicillium freii TaxID=48697 RepID=A0A117NNI1_PENFR|nr:hypothetical protein ACN42_g6326 [Penicillium freii]
MLLCEKYAKSLQPHAGGLSSHVNFLIHTYHNTYDHRVWKTGLPVRSAVLKPHAGELVVGWVTTSESSLLYVFVLVFAIFTRRMPLPPYSSVHSAHSPECPEHHSILHLNNPARP